MGNKYYSEQVDRFEAVIRKNQEDFIHSEDDIDPLIKMALIHYQFEAIHPFPDGNGRTGRIINILFLVFRGLLDLPVLYLSKAIIERKSEYYRLLREVTEKGQWQQWILFMLEAVEETAVFTRERIIAIRNLMEETMEKARQELPPHVYSKELFELLFRQPYTKGKFLVETGVAKRQTAAEYLKELEKIGVLKVQKIGRETAIHGEGKKRAYKERNPDYIRINTFVRQIQQL
ncbi:MAG TPA: Fic family protein, partial [Nitrospirae bacterium]|nr:Fic family protein [Nitrospirota bacterium]